MKMCVTVGLSFVLYGCETWYLAVGGKTYAQGLRAEH